MIVCILFLKLQQYLHNYPQLLERRIIAFLLLWMAAFWMGLVEQNNYVQLQEFCAELVSQLSAQNVPFRTIWSAIKNQERCCSSQSPDIHLINTLRRHGVRFDLTGLKNSLWEEMLRIFQRRNARIHLGKEGMSSPRCHRVSLLANVTLAGDRDFGGGDETSLFQSLPGDTWLFALLNYSVWIAYPGRAPGDVEMLQQSDGVAWE